ncbi:amino acid adenylation domain-containing protein [Undibacterium sp. 5I1]|uniref:amino acid adenylation domain-containing protein n=1 Tax=Undibacterium sp. 5I1 TaxID=3048590 RepID=UPI002B23BC84|nr:amino acid adenylation domain-containing protein [Undibacterium sp. 5I1]MEB0259440.1 amino acid adenylation domain-containing protein [Undibacterium sp. 5I1]
MLGLERVGRNDHFFELGGHSLLAVQVISRLRQMLGTDIALRELFAQPTLASLAAVVDGAAADVLSPITLAERGQPLPLSLAQQRLWFLDQLDHAAGSAYHLPAALRLHGKLDRKALRAALDRIVARHESLRTTFVSVDGSPTQSITSSSVGFALAERDLRALHGHEQQAAVARLCDDEAYQPFNLSAGPLIRGQLLSLAEDEHILLVTQHHIISDGWSINVIISEVSALYNAFSQGLDDPLPALAIQYPDYAVWQRQWLQGEVLQTQTDFWCAHLAGAPTLLELPTDRPRPPQQSYAGSSVALRLTSELSAGLRALAQRHDITVFMALLAAWSTLLARLSGQDDIVVGTPVANRQRSEVEALIGFFVNTLALRVRFDEDLSVVQLLEQVKSTSLDAYAHQELPFEQVVEAVNPPRSLAHSPLFQSMLTWNNIPAGAALPLSGLIIEAMPGKRNTVHFDLSLTLGDDGDIIDGTLDYASALFDQDTAQRIASHFQTLLAAMVTDPQQRISTLPLLNAYQRHELLDSFNNTAVDFPRDLLIHQLFEQQAAAHPEATALVFEQQQLSYGELNQRANQLAHYLIAQGIGPDQRVAICIERGIEMIVGLLGILKAGAAYVPLDPAYPKDRLDYMLQDCNPAMLLTQRALLPFLPVTSVPLLAIDDASAVLANQPGTNPDPSALGLCSAHLAYVIYTSGSTGMPKGVMVEHCSLINFWDVLKNTIYRHFPKYCRVGLNAAYSFDMSMKGILQLLSGHCVVIIPNLIRANGPDFLQYLEQHRIDTFDCTPSQLDMLLNAGLLAIPNYQPKAVLIGGEIVNRASWHQLAHAQSTLFFNMYGPTECTVDATIGLIEPSALNTHIGRPIANARIHILDRQSQLVPVGVSGEIYIGGIGVARGYLNRPELTAERFVTDPFGTEPQARLYKTGDVGRWLPNGNIEYLGRNDFQVKLRGFRIELGEIEAKLAACNGIKEAVVVARENNGGDKRLVAYLTTSGSLVPTPAALRTALSKELPDYMVPSAFVILDTLPLTPNSKLDRNALLLLEQISVDTAIYEVPIGSTEIAIAAIWQELLGHEKIDRKGHFFELGGHSIKAVQLISRIRSELKMQASLGDLLIHPVLYKFSAAIIAKTPVVTHSSLLQIRSQGNGMPLFLLHPAGGEVAYARELANWIDHDIPIYGLSAQGLHPDESPFATIPDMAKHYIGEMRHVQPQGPYYIAGWSFGGTVASEITQQLTSSGERIAFLGLIDTWHHDLVNEGELASMDEASTLMLHAEINNAEVFNRISSDLKSLAIENDIERMLALCRTNKIVPNDIDNTSLRQLLAVLHANRRAQATYVTRPLSVPSWLFAACDEVGAGATNGLTTSGVGRLTVVPLNGTHKTLVEHPNVEALGNAMTAAIVEAQKDCQASLPLL